MSKKSAPPARATRCRACIVDLLDDRLFKALGDPRRIALLVRVAESKKPCTVSEVASCCPTDVSVVSRHLAILRDAEVLVAEKRGREVYYSVRCSELAATLHALADAIAHCAVAVTKKAKEARA